jgi:hypothetical protein
MQGILIFILSYLSLLLAWFVISIVFYLISLISKKNLAFIPLGLTYIVAFLIQWYIFGYAAYLLWSMIKGHEWLMLLFSLLVGGFVIGWWQMIYNFLLAPFYGIANYYSDKLCEVDFKEEIVQAEVLDMNNKVIDVIEGETSIKTRFAKYFIGLYFFNLLYLLVFPEERKGLLILDYITKPFLQIIGATFLIGIPFGIYRLIRYRKFFTKDKRYFFIQTWKVALYIFIPFTIFLFLVSILTNTY